jgi:hypothetical protein
MKIVLIIASLFFNFSCKSSQNSELVEYSKGIGLLTSESKTITIFPDISCSSSIDLFSSVLSGKSRIFGKHEVEKTNFKNFEYGYEEYYLPVVQVYDAAKKFKIIYQDDKGSYNYGYVQMDENNYVFKYWSEFLIDKPLFFINHSNYKIFEYRDGPEIDLEKSSFSNHIMWPEFQHEGWMNVKLVTPSDYCVKNSECSRIINGVIRFTDENGNLIVWYHTRGC